MTKTLIDIGDTTCGILLTWDGKDTFTVLSHGRGHDRREVTFEDPADAAAEVLGQSQTLKLHTKLIQDKRYTPSIYNYILRNARHDPI